MKRIHLPVLALAFGLALVAMGCDEDDPYIYDAWDTGSDVPHDSTDTISPDVPYDTLHDTVTPDTIPDPVPDIGVDDTPAGCTHTGFTAAVQAAMDSRPTYQQFVYNGGSASAEPMDIIAIEFFGGFGSPPPTFAPGTFTVAGSTADQNYETCGTCLLVREGCGSDGTCTKYFFATGGSMTIETWGAVGGTFAGSLTDVDFEEVTIASDGTYHSTPVPGGETWCIPSYSFTATIEAG